MPMINSSVAALLSSLDITLAPSASDHKSDGFVSLLDIFSEQDTPAEVKAPHKDQDIPAAPIDVPLPMVNAPAVQNAESPTPPEDRPVVDEKPSLNLLPPQTLPPKTTPSQTLPPKTTPPQTSQQTVSDTKGNDNPSSSDTVTDTANAANQSNAADASTDIDQTAQQLSNGLKKQFDAIDQILLSIIQALGGSVAAQTPSTPIATSVDTTPSDPAPVANAGSIVAPGGSIDTLSDGDNPEVALLKDIQQILAQLPAALSQISGVGNQPLTPAQMLAILRNPDASTAGVTPDALQTLVAQLEKDVVALSQWLKQPDNGTPAPSSSDATLANPLSADTPTQGNIKALLKQDIAQVRQQLQQLQSQNDQVFAQAQQRFHAQLDQADPSLKTMLSAMLPKTDTTSGAAVTAATENTPAAPALTAATQTPLPGLPQVITPPVAAIQPTAVQPSTDTSSNNNSNSGSQGQSMPMPVLGAATAGGTASAAADIGNFSFARALNQMAPNNVMEQVVFHIKTALGDGSSKIHIQLDPAELGRLDIKLEVKADGKTGVLITADNQNTLNLLQRDAQGLARALSDAGLTADSGNLSFNLNGGQSHDTGQSDAQAASTYQKAQPEEPALADIGAITRSYTVNLAEGLDITI